jgi:PHP family Zn ribbon phosphoesterase
MELFFIKLSSFLHKMLAVFEMTSELKKPIRKLEDGKIVANVKLSTNRTNNSATNRCKRSYQKTPLPRPPWMQDNIE